MKIAIVTQARMGATRLPGKVMIDLCGKPMLWHFIERLKKIRNADEIIVATTKNPKDDVIVRAAISWDVKVSQGSEEDVLARYYFTAKEHKVDVIVRITSDDPLIDPKVVDKIIKYYINSEGKMDYVSNNLVLSYPLGLDTEVFSFSVLEKAWREAKEPYQREHVTPYIYEHPEIFRLANVKNSEDLSYLRWTVDEEKDLKFVREVYKRLYKEDEVFLMQDVLNLLKKEPQLLEINKEIRHKKLGE